MVKPHDVNWRIRVVLSAKFRTKRPQMFRACGLHMYRQIHLAYWVEYDKPQACYITLSCLEKKKKKTETVIHKTWVNV
jgi:hypothetical protein